MRIYLKSIAKPPQPEGILADKLRCSYHHAPRSLELHGQFHRRQLTDAGRTRLSNRENHYCQLLPTYNSKSLHGLTPQTTQGLHTISRQMPSGVYLPLLAFPGVEVFARLQRQSFLLEKQYYEGTSARTQIEALEEGWAIVHDTRLYMTNSQNSIKKFASPTSSLTQIFFAIMRYLWVKSTSSRKI